MTLPRQPAESAALTQSVINALNSSGLGRIGAAYVVDLRADRFGQWRASDDIYPASVIKIALMTETYRRFAEGSLSPDHRVTIDAANLTETAEPMLTAGSETEVQELIELMITRSDNVATNQLFDVLRRERVTDSMRALGLEGFWLGRKLSGADPLIEDPEVSGRNSLRPDAAARLLQLIALDAVPGAGEQRAILGRCVDNDMLVPGLREGDHFMHKTGETSAVRHDAGILHTAEGGEYVVVLYTTSEAAPDDGDATRINAQMAAWMRHLRDSL